MNKGRAPLVRHTVRSVRGGLGPGPGKAPEGEPRATGSSEGHHLSPYSLGGAGSGWKVSPKVVTIGCPQVFVAPSLWVTCHSRTQGQRIKENPEMPAVMGAVEGGADGQEGKQVHKGDDRGGERMWRGPPEAQRPGVPSEGRPVLGLPGRQAFLRETAPTGPCPSCE